MKIGKRGGFELMLDIFGAIGGSMRPVFQPSECSERELADPSNHTLFKIDSNTRGWYWTTNDILADLVTELGRTGGAAAVDALCQQFSRHGFAVRAHILNTLGWIGDPRGLETIMIGLSNRKSLMHDHASIALSMYGDATTLPLIILKAIHLPVVTRIRLLERLQGVRGCGCIARTVHRDDLQFVCQMILPNDFQVCKEFAVQVTPETYSYKCTGEARHIFTHRLPRLTVFCQKHLQHEDPQVRQSAREILDVLTHSELLRSNQSSLPEVASGQLLRSASDNHRDEAASELVRGSETLEEKSQPVPFWKRWFARS